MTGLGAFLKGVQALHDQIVRERSIGNSSMRFSKQTSYDHQCKKITWGYEISWVVDYYYSGSRLRYPRTFRRITDELGAVRFCKKWNLEPPELETPS